MNTRSSSSIYPGRIMLHVFFWLAAYLIFIVIYSVKSNYFIAARNSLFYMPLHMAYFYIVAYWLVPVYLLNTRYLKFAGILLLLVFMVALTGRLIDVWLVNPYMM